MKVSYTPCPKCMAVNRVQAERADQKQAKCSRCHSLLNYHDHISAVNTAGLEKMIQASPMPIIVDFWAAWCGPCQSFAPAFAAAAKELAGEFVFLKLDTEANPDSGAKFGIRGIPLLIKFYKGAEVKRQAGAMSLPVFKNWVRS